jgi:DNA-binding NtrC family response regulator
VARILVVDDDPQLRKLLRRGLGHPAHEIDDAVDGRTAIDALDRKQYEVVLTDLRMAGADGVAVLKKTLTIQPRPALILMSGHGTIEIAVDAIKAGAFDFVQKPFEIEHMRLKIERALEFRRLKNQLDYLNHLQPHIYSFDRIVGASGTLQQALTIVRKVARSSSTILIRGETGTGKELIAAAVHYNSERADQAFVKVNCAALHENLLESELFGHEKGAFTSADRQRIGRFEQADEGTLFLDEIGDMSLTTQAKVLRVLQEHEFERLGGTRTLRVDVRLIAATNRDLPAMVQAGQFREDLYYRLNVVSIEMPPLRERKDDIVPLANSFLRRFAGELKKKIDGLEPDAQKLLMRYNWPGNIRELENTVERAILLAEGRAIASVDLRLGEVATTSGTRDHGAVVKIPPTGIPLEDIERHALVEALKMSNWVQKDAAELLSISPRVMNYKIKTLGIEFPRGRRAAPLAQHPPVAAAS